MKNSKAPKRTSNKVTNPSWPFPFGKTGWYNGK